MYYVYLLKNRSSQGKTYIGLTENIDKRLKEHNSGNSRYTKNLEKWEIEVYIAFKNKYKAIEFEKYLKQGSGFAFAKKHFWDKT